MIWIYLFTADFFPVKEANVKVILYKQIQYRNKSVILANYEGESNEDKK
jgi:hypothetical protein